MKTVSKFFCLGDRLNPTDGCETAVTARSRISWMSSGNAAKYSLRTWQNLACKLAIPRYNLFRLQRSIQYGGIKISGSTSFENRNSPFTVFKKKYKQRLLAFY